MTRTHSPRRGNAPLEFVLVLPLLLTVCVVSWWAAQVGYTRVQTATDARRLAWANRDKCEPGTAFDPRADPLASYHGEEAATLLPRRSPIDGSTLTATAAAGVTDKTHDHEQFEFPKLLPRIDPHTAQLIHFTPFAPGVVPPPTFTAMDPHVNPLMMQAQTEGPKWTLDRTKAVAEMNQQVSHMTKASQALNRRADKYQSSPNPILQAIAVTYRQRGAIIDAGSLSVAWNVLNNTLR